jgi:(1->4)-alpha-D-glucan 1-alpha-D-glucosylmutase
VHTSWINPNHEYEAAISIFVHGLLKPGRNIFLERLRTAAETVGWLGMLNSLSMTALKLTSPGVPDLYQGTELWDFSLVDPDNRRPVDYAARSALLAQLPHVVDVAGVRELFRAARDGRAKLFLIARLLAFRRKHPELFFRGGYLPVHASGWHQANVVAFARTHGDRGLITVATRLHASLGIGDAGLPCGDAIWGDTVVDVSFLPDGAKLEHLLTGRAYVARNGTLQLAEVLADVPVCALAY